MITEIVLLTIKPGLERQFEKAIADAGSLIASTPGYLDHSVKRCLEVHGRYVLIVNWKDLDAHLIGFRTSDNYQIWKQRLHHFYDPFPTVEHYADILK